MSRFARPGLLLIALLVAAIAVTGCTQKVPPVVPEDPDPPQEEPAPAGDPLMPLRFGPVVEYPVKAVSYPVRINHLVENNLEFSRNMVGSTREVYVAGLKDLAVQEKINANLAELYDFVRTGGIPPYRGVRTIVPEDSKLMAFEFEAMATFNSNDVLSIVVRYYKEYSAATRRWAPIVQGIETRNFDLTTGEEIPLSYVFCDDVDYLALLNDSMQRRYVGLKATEDYYGMFDDWAPILVAPFRGVRADHVYYLHDGELCLVLDHRTPEFELNQFAIQAALPFSDFPGAIAITERFYDKDADLYVSRSQRTLSLPTVQNQQKSLDSEMTSYLGESHAYMVYYRIPSTVSPAVRSFVASEFAAHRSIVESFAGRGEGYWTLYKGMYTRQVGQYTMVFMTEVENRLEEPIGFIEELQWMMHMGDQSYSIRESIYCFTAEGEVIGLPDLFVPGFDYEGIIRDAYARVQGYAHVRRPAYEEIASRIAFSLESREISFLTPYLETHDGYKQSIRFSIPYKDIGYENLTIFH